MKQMRLDSSANIYQAIATSDYPQVYRLSVSVITAVVPELLEQAVRETLSFFPAFHGRLKRGRFWYSLEETDSMPEIRKVLFRKIQSFAEDGLLFRFLYEGNWIHLEVFHALTDGSGSLHFLNAVCYRYCQLAYPQVLPDGALEKRYGLEGGEQLQDEYLSLSGQHGSFWSLLQQRKAFRISGEKRQSGQTEVMTVRIPLSKLRGNAGMYHATVCELLTAVCLLGLCREYGRQAAESGRKLRIEVPVNLRPYFRKKTERNFFTCIPVETDAGEACTLERLLESVKRQFKEKCTRKYLEEKVAGQVSGQEKAMARYAPLFLKNWFLRTIYRFNGYSTTVLSNLGTMRPEKEFAPCITGYRCILPVTEREPLKIGVCAYHEELAFTIVWSLCKCRMAERIAGIFREMGVSILLEGEQPEAREIEKRKKNRRWTEELKRCELEQAGGKISESFG